MTLMMRDQENIEKGREEGREEGLREGVKEGEKRFAELTQKLLKDKRYSDLERGTQDLEYRQKLYQEYNIK